MKWKRKRELVKLVEVLRMDLGMQSSYLHKAAVQNDELQRQLREWEENPTLAAQHRTAEIFHDRPLAGLAQLVASRDPELAEGEPLATASLQFRKSADQYLRALRRARRDG